VTLRWVGGGLALAAVVGLAFYWPRSVAAAPDFSDALTGPASPNLAIPFQAYALTPEGLLRSESATNRTHGKDRPMVKTLSGAYLRRDFIFEVDVMIPADTQDIAYVGFGRGEPNPDYSMEPSGAFLFRIHGLSGVGDVHAAAAAAAGRGTNPTRLPHLRLEAIGKCEPGRRTTFRIEHAGTRVTLSMPGTPGASHTFEIASYPELFDDRSGFLFFGNSSEGTVFSQVRVGPRS
jgi:hypothetical protein